MKEYYVTYMGTGIGWDFATRRVNSTIIESDTGNPLELAQKIKDKKAVRYCSILYKELLKK